MDIEQMRRSAETPVRAVSAADLDGAARDLNEAFAADPVFSWFCRTDAQVDAQRLRFFQFFLKVMASDQAEVLRPATGGAAAVWLPFEALGPFPLSKEVRAVPVMLGLTGWSRIGRLLKQREAMDKHHKLDRPHAYLSFLGVTPQAQGHGVGSRLLSAKLRELDRQGMPAYLETQNERNVALYRRHGFEVASEFRPTPDGPLQWTMWREPADDQ